LKKIIVATKLDKESQKNLKASIVATININIKIFNKKIKEIYENIRYNY